MKMCVIFTCKYPKTLEIKKVLSMWSRLNFFLEIGEITIYICKLYLLIHTGLG